METPNETAIKAINAIINEHEAIVAHLKQTLILLQSGVRSDYSLPTNSSNNDDKNPPYPLNKKLRDKINFAFDKHNRFILIREANEILTAAEPALSTQATQIRNAITNMKQDKLLISIKTGKSNNSFVWGRPEWLDGNGAIKPEHDYNHDLPEVD